MKLIFVSMAVLSLFICTSSVNFAATSNHDSIITIAQMEPDDPMQYEEGTLTGEDIFGDYSPEEEIDIDKLSDDELKEMGFSDEDIKELRSSTPPASDE